uniref:recombinase family protein n=1 Tax=Armatimonas sp. TaxID=1872638 RepID=UPI00286D542B
IIAWHPDRLARNELDGSAITYRLRKGILKEMVFVEYTFINSPEGIMMLQMIFSQSQYFVSKLSIEVTRGLEDKVALGWNPHRAPPGYVNDTHLSKGQKSISPDPERFPLLQRAWHMLADGGHTVEQVRKLLNESWGYRTPINDEGEGGKPLARSSFYRLLSNVFYAGLFFHSGEIHKGAHKPMVTLEEFQRIQERIRREKLGKAGDLVKEENAALRPVPLASSTKDLSFSGLIRCARCGSQVTATVKIKPSGRRYVYYHCSNSRGMCPRGGVREEEIQLQIEGLLKVISINDTFYRWAMEDLEKAFHSVRAVQDAQRAQRRRALEDIEKKRDGLIDMMTRNLLDEEEYRQRRSRLLLDKEHLQKEEQMGDEQVEQVRQTCVNVVEFAKNAHDWLLYGEVNVKRLVAQHLVSNWRLDGKNLIPELNTLLRPLAENYPSLLREMERIELGGIGSESTKKEAIASIRSAWSDMWDNNRTLAKGSGGVFPDVVAKVKAVLDVRSYPDRLALPNNPSLPMTR